MELFEWSKHYIKFKDCMKKNILEMECKADEIHVKEKQREIIYYIDETITTSIKKLQNKREIIITTNTKENFTELIKNWEKLAKQKELTIIFSHPKNNETWSLHPYTHNNITEDKLEEGLQTLFESIARV